MAPSDSSLTLASLNDAPPAAVVAALGQIVEHSPWVADQIVAQRPFASVDALWSAMVACIRAAGPERQDALFRMHPELAGAEAVAGSMTASSTSEQGRLGLTTLSPSDFAHLADLNRRYRETFGFPCIIALRLHGSRESVFAAFERRLTSDLARERDTNISQIAAIIRGRLHLLLPPAGWLSTHVLDTTTGRPAAGMRIDLHEEGAEGARLVATTLTNADGRTDAPLLTGATMMAGAYRLTFHVAAYHRAKGMIADGVPFLNEVPIAFGIADPNLHVHVPLLCTPWSYATYRGS